MVFTHIFSNSPKNLPHSFPNPTIINDQTQNQIRSQKAHHLKLSNNTNFFQFHCSKLPKLSYGSQRQRTTKTSFSQHHAMLGNNQPAQSILRVANFDGGATVLGGFITHITISLGIALSALEEAKGYDHLDLTTRTVIRMIARHGDKHHLRIKDSDGNIHLANHGYNNSKLGQLAYEVHTDEDAD